MLLKPFISESGLCGFVCNIFFLVLSEIKKWQNFNLRFFRFYNSSSTLYFDSSCGRDRYVEKVAHRKNSNLLVKFFSKMTISKPEERLMLLKNWLILGAAGDSLFLKSLIETYLDKTSWATSQFLWDKKIGHHVSEGLIFESITISLS